jgi:hypothetical protein
MSNHGYLTIISSILSLSLAVLAGTYARHLLGETYNTNYGLAIVLCIIIAISQNSTIAIKFIINRSELIKKIILHREYIDGTWIDIVRHKDEIIGYGIIVVSTDSDFIHINGQDFSKKFKWQYPFAGRTNIINWPDLTVIFTGGQFSPSLPSLLMIHIQDNTRSVEPWYEPAVPNHWTAKFSSQSHRKNENFEHSHLIYSTEAWKITDKGIIHKLNAPESTESTLEELVNKYFKKYAHQTHLNDF